jgi:hypothetical protein
VYALRTGDNGENDPAARNDVASDGSATLWLPTEGVYDVGARLAKLPIWTLETHVDTRYTRDVSLALPAGAAIQFEVDPSVARADDVRVLLFSSDDRPESDTPGVGAVAWTRSQVAGPFPAALSSVAGVALDARTAQERLRCIPERFEAPCVVSVRPEDRGRIHLTGSVSPPERTAGHDAVASLKFSVDDDSRLRWSDGWLRHRWRIARGQRVSDVVKIDGLRVAGRRRCTVSWTGRGFVPGAVAVDVPDGATVDVPIDVRLDESAPLEGEEEATVTVVGPSGAANVTCLFPDSVEWTGGSVRCTSSAVDEMGTPFVVPVVGPRIAAKADHLVAEPIALRSGMQHVLTLRPAGFVSITRGVRPPKSVDLVLYRRDGGPIGTPFSDDADWPSSTSIVLYRSVVIGPLPEGDIAFVVSAGGMDLCEMTARVVAGKITDVRLPLADRLKPR